MARRNRERFFESRASTEEPTLTQETNEEILRLEFYKLITGNREAAEVPENFSFSPEIQECYKLFLERRAELIEAFKREYQSNRDFRKSGGEKGGVEKAEAEVWRENAERAYQEAMRNLQRNLLEDFLRRKKEKYPELTAEDLKKEALLYSSHFLLEAVKNIDLDLELRKIEALREIGDGNRIELLLERYNRLDRTKKLIISAAISAGIGAGAALLLGPGGLFGVAALPKIGLLRRFVRSLGGGSLAAAITSGAEKFWLRSKFAKQRGEIMQREQSKLLKQLSEEAKRAEDWLENEIKKKHLLELVQKEARNYEAQLREQARKERRTRIGVAFAAGLVGGLAAAGVDWHLIQGSNRAAIVQSAIENRPKATEVASSQTSSSLSPEQVAAAREAVIGETAEKALRVSTVKPGDSLWEVTRRFIKEGVITEDQWRKGWRESMVEIISHGEKKTVPISEVGLIHSGDQVLVIQEGDKVIFKVVDYAKDNFRLGDNEALFEIYKSSGKPVPAWLEQAVQLKKGVKSALESSGAVIESESLKLNQAATAGPEALIANPPSPRLLDENRLAEIIDSFKKEDLAGQQEILYNIAAQKQEISNLLSFNSQDAATYLNWSAELTNLENALRGMPEYLKNLELFNSFLRENELVPLFNQVKFLKVGDFLAIAKGVEPSEVSSGLVEIFEKNQAGWLKLASVVEKLEPGRPELKLPLIKFLEKNIG